VGGGGGGGGLNVMFICFAKKNNVSLDSPKMELDYQDSMLDFHGVPYDFDVNFPSYRAPINTLTSASNCLKE